MRGCARVVQVLSGARIVAQHPRHGRARLVIDPAHYEGETTETVRPPTPLGRMGRRLQEIAAMAPEQPPARPLRRPGGGEPMSTPARSPLLPRSTSIPRGSASSASACRVRPSNSTSSSRTRSRTELPPHRFLDQLLEAELTLARGAAGASTSLRLSGLPTGQTLGKLRLRLPAVVERSRIETLATCAWIRERHNLLIQGPPGVGKTHLAIALGVQAVENGFSVGLLSGSRTCSRAQAGRRGRARNGCADAST